MLLLLTKVAGVAGGTAAAEAQALHTYATRANTAAMLCIDFKITFVAVCNGKLRPAATRGTSAAIQQQRAAGWHCQK